MWNKRVAWLTQIPVQSRELQLLLRGPEAGRGEGAWGEAHTEPQAPSSSLVGLTAASQWSPTALKKYSLLCHSFRVK